MTSRWAHGRECGRLAATWQQFSSTTGDARGNFISVVTGQHHLGSPTTSAAGTGPYDIIAVRKDSTTLATTIVTTTTPTPLTCLP